MLIEIKGGWMAVGAGCAIPAESRDEAVRRYREARARHAVIRARVPANEPSQPSARSPIVAQD